MSVGPTEAGACSLVHRLIFYLDSLRPIKTAEDFEAIAWLR